jgi:hypothetical protein
MYAPVPIYGDGTELRPESHLFILLEQEPDPQNNMLLLLFSLLYVSKSRKIGHTYSLELDKKDVFSQTKFYKNF